MSIYRPIQSSSPYNWSNLEKPSDINLVELIYLNKIHLIQNYLEQNPEYDLTKIKARSQYTLLHFACINNQINTCKLLLAHMKKGDSKTDIIKAWVNEKTETGQTALYFASVNGNLGIINLLEENGADIYLRDNEGLTLMHAAAQGNKPLSLIYFNTKGLSLNETDYKGKTPLHIAATEGSLDIIRYLTAEKTSINIQENEFGYTPLHCAVLSGNTHAIVKLLKKGASPNIRDFKGQLPIEIATKNSSFVIVEILQEKNCLVKCLGINQRSSRKKYHYTFSLSFVFILSFLVAHIFFVLPYIESKGWVISFALSFFLTSVFFLITWLADPGFIRHKEGEDLLFLLQHYNSEQICPDCVVLKPLRSRHCEACGICVSVYDHHCTWTNNCVGAKNHKYFIVFIFVVLASLINLIVLDVVHFLKKDAVYKYWRGIKINERTLLYGKNIFCAVCILISVSLAIPLFYLCYVQVVNLFKGKTTIERFGRNKEEEEDKRGDSKEYSKLFLGRRKQTRSQRLCANIMNICFRNARNPEYTTNLSHIYHERMANTL